MPEDSPVPAEPLLPPAGPQIPAGSSLVHGRADASEIWRLCCRIRLSMRDEGLGIRDAHQMLLMAYPDLKIGQKELKLFMEQYVDESIVLGPGFFKRGLMKSKAKLNAVAEAAELADLAKKAVERVKGAVSLQDLPKYTLAVERAQKMQERKYDLMDRIGMGAESDRDRAAPAKTVPAGPPQVHIDKATFDFSGSVGGSFARRSGSIDVEGKAKA